MEKKYPSIDDNNFQDIIYQKFKKYEIASKKPTFKELCFPEKFKYQLPQLFVSKFINPQTPYKSLLVYHRIGAGKTCAAIKIAEEWKSKRRIIFIVPASLVNNLYKELRSECTGNDYVTTKERKNLCELDSTSKEYKDLIEKIHNRINKVYEIFSYHKFVSLVQSNDIDLKNAVLIIDEVQNIVSEHGLFYNVILKLINKSPASTRIIALSATPIFDKPVELALTINLLKPKIPLPISNEFNETFLNLVKDNYELKNKKLLQQMLSGYISYYPGAPSSAFPEPIFKLVKCEMSNFQYQCYLTVEEREGQPNFKDILKLPVNFFIGLRIISNVAFPNRAINEKGFESFTGTKLILKNLSKYSIKFYKILLKINKTNGSSFVYSNFKEYGGIKSFIAVLDQAGYKNFQHFGPGKKRYAVWSGDETNEEKENIRIIFNDYNNRFGDNIKVILGSPSIKEGVSLLRLKSIHVMEPYWNQSRLDQIIGRGIRFCSHKDVEKKDRAVKIFLYLASAPKTEKITVDEYIHELTIKKNYIINQFTDVMQKSAVDYQLFKNAEKFITEY